MDRFVKFCSIALSGSAILLIAGWIVTTIELGFPPVRPGEVFYEMVYLGYASDALNNAKTLELVSYILAIVGVVGLTVYLSRISSSFGITAGIIAIVGLLCYGAESMLALAAADFASYGGILDPAFVQTPRLEVVLILDTICGKFYYVGVITSIIAYLLFTVVLFARSGLSRISAIGFIITVLSWFFALICFGLDVNLGGEVLIAINVFSLAITFILLSILILKNKATNLIK